MTNNEQYAIAITHQGEVVGFLDEMGFFSKTIKMAQLMDRESMEVCAGALRELGLFQHVKVEVVPYGDGSAVATFSLPTIH